MAARSLSARGLSGPTFALLGLILLVVAGMFAALVISVRSLDSISQANRAAGDINARSLRLERVAVDLETGVRGYLLTHDRAFLEPYEKARAIIDPQTRELVRLSPPEDRAAAAERIRTDLLDYVRNYTDPLLAGPTGRETIVQATTEGKRRLDALRGEFAALTSAQQADDRAPPRRPAAPAPPHAGAGRRRLRA